MSDAETRPTGTDGTEQLGARTPAGTVIGGATTDLIGFYGTATPVAQAAAITLVSTTATSDIATGVVAILAAINTATGIGITA